jgi:2-polyprenyl-3-methyl-5-hydroxy-6-metoxy-1,4-benzoquinol methylase
VTWRDLRCPSRSPHHASMVLEERTVVGLHDFVNGVVLPAHTSDPGSAIDLGAGSGAFVSRIATTGWNPLAVERDAAHYKSDVPLLMWDLNSEESLAEKVGHFDLVIAMEVLEHVESPAAFLRTVAELLTPRSIAVLTTPNVESVLARTKFLLTGKLQMFDEG